MLKMEETRNADGEDRISRLTDALIHQILSFNGTKDAIQTCVLSKRWIHIWKSMPYLELDRRLSFPRGREHDQRFIDFVDMVFDFRDDDFDIQRCLVSWLDFHDTATSHVNRWIVHAAQRNVQEMTISISKSRHTTYEIPHHLLNCKSLTRLVLQVFPTNARHADIILPRSMNLPQLRDLSLYLLSISDVESSKKLFSSCPVLETLRIYECDIQTGNQRYLTVDSLNLKRFEYGRDMHRLPQNENTANVIKLCAPNLEDFTLTSQFAQDYSIEHCSPLSRANFWMGIKVKEEAESSESSAKRLMKLLGAVYMVKDLSLSPGFLEVLSQALDVSDYQPPRLRNLQCLTLGMWFTRRCLRSIAYLIKISPNIVTILLTSMESNSADVGDNWEAGLSLPGMLSHLEFVQIKEVEGCDNELKFLGFLLKNAMLLKKVVLYPRSTIDSPDEVEERFRDKLRALPRASSCIIMHWPATKSTHLI